MTPLFKKMNYKAQDPIAILSAPDGFRDEMIAMQEFARIDESLAEGQKYEFVLIFVRSGAEMVALEAMLKGRFGKDPLLWIAYPKKSSKKYKTDIHRDSGHWAVLGKLGFEPVRQVAIDEDWSALRFRDAAFIKTMKRDQAWAMSELGKEKTKKD